VNVLRLFWLEWQLPRPKLFSRMSPKDVPPVFGMCKLTIITWK